ncbi:MAG: hypothetical protein JWL95_2311 [Gemmatimonadetes bacterium]|nr:hypothetical protein [Gemmatimonadota bacterium]
MTGEDEWRMDAAAEREGLATQLRELEAFIARSESSGEELPPEASEMIARLREIVQALDSLTSSLADPSDPPAG